LWDATLELVQQVVPQRVEAIGRNHLSRVLEVDELEVAMRELKNEKFLGLGGFPLEFHKKMWYVVGVLCT
jgi:hypothetical protein